MRRSARRAPATTAPPRRRSRACRPRCAGKWSRSACAWWWSSPGAFRTDFSGRSITESSTVIDDYADTAGKRRKRHDRTDGTQPGDPAKAAQALISAVGSEQPPALLLLGNDAVSSASGVLRSRLEELERWRELSTSTDLSD